MVELKINDAVLDGFVIIIIWQPAGAYNCKVDQINNVSYTNVYKVEINSDTITREVVSFYERHNKRFNPLDPGY